VLEGLALLDELMSEFHRDAPRVFPHPFHPFASDAWRALDRLSIRERLDAMGLSRKRSALLEGVLGASAHGSFSQAGLVEMLRWWALSGNDLFRYSDSVARYRLRDGTSSLIEAMLADAAPELRLGAPVARIAQEGGRVAVAARSGEVFAARAAVVALPMNVLANVEFSPALAPAKLAASRERHAGAGVKVYARIAGRVPELLGLAAEDSPLSTLMTAQAGEDGGVLLGFGTDPRKLDVHSKAAVEAVVRRFLPQARVSETLAYDWSLDPYSLGTWCVFRKGQMSKYLAALREPQGLVHFAGGDFALGWRGFIDGAIESGTRVARDVIDQLGGRGASARERAAAAALPAQGPPPPVAAAAGAFRPCAVCHSAGGAGAARRRGPPAALRGTAARRSPWRGAPGRRARPGALR